MVTCRSLIDRLGTLVDGSADPTTTVIANRHLEHCLSCARYFQTYETTITLAREASRRPQSHDQLGMPESLTRRILWARRARSVASSSRQIFHLIGVAASPLIVFSLAR